MGVILDPINLTTILATISWPLFAWLAIRTVAKAAVARGEQDLEKLKLVQQHEVVRHVQNEELK